MEDGVVTNIQCEDTLELYFNKDRDATITQFNPIVQVIAISQDKGSHCTIYGRYFK